jgi:DedD protein
MAFFKSRKGGDETATTHSTGSGQAARQSESVEAMRRRAKHRLIGAAVLVLVGVVGFPLLFDTQPRPISVDIPIEIPDRNKVLPLPVPKPAPATKQAPVAQAPAASGSVTQAAAVEVPAPKPEPKVEAKAEPRPELKPEARPETKTAGVKPEQGAKALALLEGKPVATTPAASEGRFVVQVGAFSDVTKARETRLKVEHAGLKTYTQVVETKDGKRIRVRVGPFATKAQAEQAADKVKGLDLQAAVLTL